MFSSNFIKGLNNVILAKGNNLQRYNYGHFNQLLNKRCSNQSQRHTFMILCTRVNLIDKKRICLPLSTSASFTAHISKNAYVRAMSSNEPEIMSEEAKNAKSIYDFKVNDTHGQEVSLDKYKGNVVLIVNIASRCGLTKNNYKKLTELLETYGERGLKILNFPCNQFASEMPEADGEDMVCHLRDAKANIGDVFKKVDVNGSDAAPLYQYLKSKQGGTLGSAIKWNFTKFLVDKEGIPVKRYGPTTDPMDIAKDIEKML